MKGKIVLEEHLTTPLNNSNARLAPDHRDRTRWRPHHVVNGSDEDTASVNRQEVPSR